jgi:hypothetical protein
MIFFFYSVKIYLVESILNPESGYDLYTMKTCDGTRQLNVLRRHSLLFVDQKLQKLTK